MISEIYLAIDRPESRSSAIRIHPHEEPLIKKLKSMRDILNLVDFPFIFVATELHRNELRGLLKLEERADLLKRKVEEPPIIKRLENVAAVLLHLCSPRESLELSLDGKLAICKYSVGRRFQLLKMYKTMLKLGEERSSELDGTSRDYSKIRVVCEGRGFSFPMLPLGELRDRVSRIESGAWPIAGLRSHVTARPEGDDDEEEGNEQVAGGGETKTVHFRGKCPAIISDKGNRVFLLTDEMAESIGSAGAFELPKKVKSKRSHQFVDLRGIDKSELFPAGSLGLDDDDGGR